MKRSSVRIGVLGLAVAAATLIAVPAASADTPHRAPQSPVFVQTDAVGGNAVVSYDRAPDGTLTQAGTYATGGIGGVLDGAVVDNTASQGSVAYGDGLLYVANAGSNSVTVFAVHGDRLQRRQVIGSGGNFPVSITVHHNIIEVLNARDGGSVQGFVRVGEFLRRIPTWNRPLGLDAAQTPEFVSTPGQVAFTPDGSKVVVTTKANGNSIDVFDVNAFGELSSTPVVNTEPNTVPFAMTFDASGRLVVAEAGANAVETFTVNPDGSLTSVDQQLTGQAGTCWIVGNGTHVYASNAGSGTVTGYSDAGNGSLVSLGNTETDAGTVDAAISSDGNNLYVQTGKAGVLDEFGIKADGSLTEIGSVTVPNAVGAEGIVAL